MVKHEYKLFLRSCQFCLLRSRSLNASNSKLHWSTTIMGQSYYSDYSNPSAYYGVAVIVIFRLVEES